MLHTVSTLAFAKCNSSCKAVIYLGVKALPPAENLILFLFKLNENGDKL